MAVEGFVRKQQGTLRQINMLHGSIFIIGPVASATRSLT